MKKKYYAPSEEVSKLFAFEWKRAKRILKPFLDHKKIPKLYMATSLNGAVGTHWGDKGTMWIKLGRGARRVWNSNVIALKEERDLDQTKHTIRHEICHCLGYKGHEQRFKNALKSLEQARTFEESLG